MITEDYVNFEISKLLKEKGFDEKCRYVWILDKAIDSEDNDGVYKLSSPYFMEGESYISNEDIDRVLQYSDEYYNKDAFLCPTLSVVVKWLREVHNLSVEVYRTACGYVSCIVAIPSGTDIEFLEEEGDDLPSGQYTTWDKACETGIKYCLENLI